MTIQERMDQIHEEILQLESDFTQSPEEDRPIIREEINRLTAEIAKLQSSVEPTGVRAATDTVQTPIRNTVLKPTVQAPVQMAATLTPEEQDLINEARSETGEGARLRFPSAIKLKTDGKKIEKIVDGEVFEGKPLQRFVHVYKEGEEWKTEDWGPTLTGIVLKVRRQIQEKWEEGQKTRYRSYEYTQGDLIRVYTGLAKDPIMLFEGNEDELVEEFKTGELNSVGKPKVGYDKFALVYMLVKHPTTLEPTLAKFETKISVMDHPIWNYLFSFGDNDTFLAYETVITLEWIEANAQAKFWRPIFSRGNRVDLKQSLDYLKELNKLFDMMDGKRKSTNATSVPTNEDVPLPEEHPMIDAAHVEDFSQPETDDIKIQDIPF